jgi:hypothetical protein
MPGPVISLASPLILLEMFSVRKRLASDSD